VLVHEEQTHVWYTGWNQADLTGRLLHASGPDAYHLEKRGVALDSAPPYESPKEATVVPCVEGGWRLFFEFACGGASRIGAASAPDLAGPWTISGEMFERREGQFDDWHLSPGPIAWAGSANPVMFYNGATERARWRIGWIVFDADYRTVVVRGGEPLIAPDALEEGASDVAFASSLVEQGETLWLYYSVSDMALHRATVRLTGAPG
jgi:predicted GH43/DUF377 family glycosyl hydrolase